MSTSDITDNGSKATAPSANMTKTPEQRLADFNKLNAFEETYITDTTAEADEPIKPIAIASSLALQPWYAHS